MVGIKSVYIYGGHHVWQQGTKILKGPYVQSVDKHLFMFNEVNRRNSKEWNIRLAYGEDLVTLLTGALVKSSLLVIPAGESSELDKAFSDEQIDTIKKCITLGLSVISTCGSAYWMCEERIWNDKCLMHPENAEIIRKKSRMNLFPGLAVGPLSPYPGQTYSTAFFHEAIHVKTATREVNVLLSGGGTFLSKSGSSSLDSSIVTLAEYSPESLKRFGKSSDWERAVIGFPYGEGFVILSMLHPGYGAEEIDPLQYARAFSEREDDWEAIKQSISSLDERMQFVAEILTTLERMP